MLSPLRIFYKVIFAKAPSRKIGSAKFFAFTCFLLLGAYGNNALAADCSPNPVTNGTTITGPCSVATGGITVNAGGTIRNNTSGGYALGQGSGAPGSISNAGSITGAGYGISFSAQSANVTLTGGGDCQYRKSCWFKWIRYLYKRW